MKHLVVVLATLWSAFLPTLCVEAKQDKPAPAAEECTSSSLQLLQNIRRGLENAGFEEVQIASQIFVATVKKPSGKRSTLLVDASTMKAMELEGTSDFIGRGSQSDGGLPK
jgi:hypothetical protein